jgi:hypothetical protein
MTAPSIRIIEFDTWRPGYGLADVSVFQAGTNVRANLYTDEALSVSTANPQTLLTKTVNGIDYGKFNQPIYVGVPYELQINTVDRTGVSRPPLTTLDSEDASAALVKVTGGSVATPLDDRLARLVYVLDYGAFLAVGTDGASAATNNATLTTAIGVASANGGGYVYCPAGTYQVTNFTVPNGVIVRGVARATTILQSTQAGKMATISGERAGLHRITLDGVSLVGNSVGLYAENTEVYLDDVQIKRFETGMFRQGGSLCNWRELYISNCSTGYKAYGDANASGDNLGAALQFDYWNGGTVDTCTTAGIEFKNVDEQCANITLEGVKFDTNTGNAVEVTGARNIILRDCWWNGNTKNLVVNDATPPNVDLSNTVYGLDVIGGSMDDGEVDLTGTLKLCSFRRLHLGATCTVTINTPGNNIIAEDCFEDVGLTINGDTPTAWVRRNSTQHGSSFGITTGAAATRAWGITLKSGQNVLLSAKVIGRGRSAVVYVAGWYWAAAKRVGAALAYKNQTVNYTAGNIVTGQTSGATARIKADSDSGTTGTLTVQDVVGTFLNNEIITDTGGGSAQVNGVLTESNAALVSASTALITLQNPNTAGTPAFVANGTDIEFQVTGIAATNIEWTVDVDVVSS